MLELSEKEGQISLNITDIISLKDAGIRGGALAMRPLDPENLESLQMSDPIRWPPIKVTLTTRGYVLIDGYHRWETAKRRGLDRLLADCKPYANQNDIVEAAFTANLRHGLKASTENRSDYAFWLHTTYPEMEQTEIAARACVTQSTVSKAIARREEEIRKARQQNEEELDEQTRKRQVKKSCKSFTRGALRFLDEVDDLDDGELMQTLQTVIKKQEDKTRLARIGRILSGDESGQAQATGPLRLSQFVKHS